MGSSVNKEYAAAFALVREGLWHDGSGTDCSGGAGFWSELFRIARCQTVTSLMYSGLSSLPDDMLPPDKILMPWVAAADAVERSNRKMNNTLAALLALFRNAGLRPVLQKGQGVAQFYENPLGRESGDIDFYFPDSRDAGHAVEVLAAKGIAVTGMPDGSCHYMWQGVVVEHHTRLTDIYSPFARKFLSELEQEHGFVTMFLSYDGGEVEVEIPSPFMNLLLINTHIMKHAIGWGIGLRQLCDMARACYCLHDMFDAAEMKKACTKLGIDRWSRLLHTFLVERMGLEKKYLPYDDCNGTCMPLQNIVIKGGNLGLYTPGRERSGNVLARKINTMRSFTDNVGFSCCYSPKESFWTFINLFSGQFRT